MIMFCKSYRQPAGALWLLLYCMKCKRHVTALLYHYALAIVVEAIVGKTTMMLRSRSRCRAGDDGDHDDASVISIRIANARVKRVMVDTGSSADVLYLDAFKKLGLTNMDLTPMAPALIGFTGDSIFLLGTTILLVTIGKEPRAKMIMTTFMVVDLPLAYNVILNRPTLNKLKAVVSTYHGAIKFLTLATIGKSRSDPGESR